MPQSRPCTAMGNIVVSRFVKLDPAGDFRVAQAGANELVFGISQVGARANALLDSSDPPRAAIAGEILQVEQEEGLVEFGGTIAAGDSLKSDADGKAVTSALAANDIVAAQALESGVAGTLGLVRIVRFKV